MTEEEELEQLMADALAERDAGEEELEEESEEDEEEDIEEEDESEEEVSEDDIEEDEDESEDEDGDSDDEEDESEEGGDDDNSFSPIEVEVAGSTVQITSKEEMMAYIQKGAKAFETKPETHVEEKLVIDQAGLSAEDLKLIAEVKAGSKEALAKLAKDSKIDIDEVDIESANEYKQTLEYKQASEVDKVASDILADPVQAEAFKSTVSTVPKDFVQKISSDASLLSHFNEHIKSGLAQEVIPKVKHAMMVHGGDFFEHYARIGQEVFNEKNAKPEKQKREISDKEKNLRKRASKTKSSVNSKVEAVSEDDIYAMTDAEFKEYQENFSE